MRRVLIVAFCCVASASFAETPDQALVDKLCIFSAAQKVPHVQGMEIKSGRVTDRSGNRRGIQIDISAVGQDATFGYTCILDPSGSISVVGAGLLK